MKIAIIHYSSAPVVGGVESVIQAHALKFREYGCPAEIITGRGGRFSRGVSVRVIPEMRPLHQVNKKVHGEILNGKISGDFQALKEELRRKLEGPVQDSGVCIIHNVLTMHFNLALTSALREIIDRPGKTKFISWIHDASFSDADYRDFWRDEAPWSFLKTTLPQIHNVAISRHRQKKTASLYRVPASSIKVIPDGIDPVAFLKLKPATNYLFNKLGLYSSDFIFLYPTRIVKRKNIEYAIRLVSSMNEKGKSTSLLITSQPDPYNKGSILYFRKLKKLASETGVKERVIFISEARDSSGRPFRVDEHVLRDLYLLSDLLLFTSKSEGFGIPMLEAGICRLPIACTAIPPLREIGGDDVIYLDPGRPIGETAEKISSYLENTLPVPMFRKIFREYTWDAVFEKKIIPLVKSLA